MVVGFLVLYGCGVVYGDVKFDNVFVFLDIIRLMGVLVKVVDFGGVILFEECGGCEWFVEIYWNIFVSFGKVYLVFRVKYYFKLLICV